MALEWRERMRLVSATVVVTSLAWIGGLAFFLMRDGPPLQLGLMAPAPHAAVPPPAAPQVGRLLIPVAGVAARQLTDTFTQARAGGARVHDAIDIMAPRGTPVLAAAPGQVERLFLSQDGGNTIYVRSPDRRLIYYYAHLDAYAPGLAEGQAVAAGAPLGTVGSTGNADPAGPHLHFAVLQTQPEAAWYAPALALNPYPLLMGN